MAEEENKLPVFRVNLEALGEAQSDVAKKAKALKVAAGELEQLALLEGEVAFEEAVTLPVEQIRQRYTGTQGKNIEERRLQVVKMLALQISARDICDILKMNHRTVAAIAAQEGQKIADFSESFAQVLAGSAMADIALAETKKHEAGHKDLMIAADIKLKHAQSLKMIGAAAADDSVSTVEAEEENENLKAARKFLEAQVKPQMGTD